MRIEFTPTFMGCPALDAMRRQMEEAVTALGGEPQVDVLLDDSLVDGQDHAGGPREAARGGLRPAGARGEAATGFVQLQRAVHRCPYCGSAETRLDNIFGPTPCRSLRYCTACRQPFEQFKTI